MRRPMVAFSPDSLPRSSTRCCHRSIVDAECRTAVDARRSVCDLSVEAILPRSLHRPLASTEGGATENINKTGVRLWTACSRDDRARFDLGIWRSI